MINAISISSSGAQNNEPHYAYEIAGRILLSSEPIALIESFAVPLPMVEMAGLKGSLETSWDSMNFVDATLIYVGEGSFSGGMQRVAMYQQDTVLLFEVGGQPIAIIDLVQRHIHSLSTQGLTEAIVAELILGPPLLSLFASQGVFCLHAGAVETPKGMIVFIGESGRGKSTLSRTAASQSWYNLSDDVLPIECARNTSGLLAYPRFPQLKQSEQYLDKETLPVVAIYQLDSHKDLVPIELQCMDARSALLTLVRHTVTSRVFTPDLLHDHLRFCERVCRQVPIYRLQYPHDRARLTAVRGAVLDSLS